MDRDRQGERIDNRAVANEVARDLVNKMYERYRWRPIAELHEDFGPCVGINIHDPGYLVIVHANDIEQDELVTHFTRFAPLSCEQVDKMRAECPPRACDAPGVDVDEETGTADDRLSKAFVAAVKETLCIDGHDYSYSVDPAGKCRRCGAHG